ncbi:DUF421 domain-containing protein [Pseudorhodobacter turbinis]|uniref:DUF421 domain-containing protein n=1 Tax=Pseudorhodobacter turbinis TaxID=2500533 RepID=A0A4P8EDA8_9RHOB|nr:YetF domain-containing protein [Pseudorhodobacter turbinis]QCO54727.1 DUF421 domain-containing protein [Pseudorhodobacter turbinis]
MDDPIIPFDFDRMFLGSEPALFYLEIAFRTCLIYAYSLALIRWVGGRGIAQMSTVEFLLVIALGSAVGDAMFYPEVPLLHAMLVITAVVVINKALDTLIYRYKSVEKALDGRTCEVIRDGVVIVDTLRYHNIGKSELFESLRSQGICNLGEVRQGYLETSGRFSTFRADPARRGLPIEPAWDVRPPPVSGPNVAIGAGHAMACCCCGSLTHGPTQTPSACPECNAKQWTPAINVDGRSDET